MKRTLIFSLAIISQLLHACGIGGNHEQQANGPINYGHIGFAFKDEKVDCDSSLNNAYFKYVKESKKYSTLIIQGIHKSSSHTVNTLMLEMITDSALKEGTYPIIDGGKFALCLAGKRPDSCDLLASAAIRASDNHLLTYNAIGGGQLTISKLEKGQHENSTTKGQPGYTLGTLSGSFSFPANNMNERKPTEVTGSFEQVPIKIYDKE